MLHKRILLNVAVICLLAVTGSYTSTIILDNVITYSDGVIGTVRVSDGAFSGYVCSTSSEPHKEDAKVICHQYGYSSGELNYTTLSAPTIGVKNPGCKWYEDDITDCPGGSLSSYTYSDCFTKIYRVNCSSPYRQDNDNVRIYTSGSAPTGAVERSNDNVNWSPVCSHGWTSNDAKVVCTQLGYKDGEITSASRNTGNWFHAPGCTGDEISLEECDDFTTAITSSCPSDTPGGASCSHPISDFSYHDEHVYIRGRWSRICTTDMTDEEIRHLAGTICKQTKAHNEGDADVVQDTFHTSIRSVNCTPAHTNLNSCIFRMAPSNKIFTCTQTLRFACSGDDSEFNWGLWLNLGTRLGIPLLIGIGFTVFYFLWRIQYRKRMKARAEAIANLPPPVATTGVPVNAFSMYPGPPAVTSPGTQDNALPPAYNTIYNTQYSTISPTASTQNTNQVAPANMADPTYVPDAAKYRLPPISNTTNS